MVTFPSASTEIGPVVIGVTFIVSLRQVRLVSFPNTLPADTGVVPANGADTVPNVSSVAMI
jgi:hypothetical protein